VTGVDVYRGIGPAGAGCGILIRNSDDNEVRGNSVVEQRNGGGVARATTT
jgi:hypothetical protein